MELVLLVVGVLVLSWMVLKEVVVISGGVRLDFSLLRIRIEICVLPNLTLSTDFGPFVFGWNLRLLGVMKGAYLNVNLVSAFLFCLLIILNVNLGRCPHVPVM